VEESRHTVATEEEVPEAAYAVVTVYCHGRACTAEYSVPRWDVEETDQTPRQVLVDVAAVVAQQAVGQVDREWKP